MSGLSDRSDPVEPFRSEPAQLAGCGKPAVIGCLVLLVLVGLGLGVLVWKARDLLGFAIGEYQAAVMAALPEDLRESERQRLERAFDRALAAIEGGDMNPAGLQKLQRALASPPRPGEVLEREEVIDLIEALETIAGDDNALNPDRPAVAPIVAAGWIPAAPGLAG